MKPNFCDVKEISFNFCDVKEIEFNLCNVRTLTFYLTNNVSKQKLNLYDVRKLALYPCE